MPQRAPRGLWTPAVPVLPVSSGGSGSTILLTSSDTGYVTRVEFLALYLNFDYLDLGVSTWISMVYSASDTPFMGIGGLFSATHQSSPPIQYVQNAFPFVLPSGIGLNFNWSGFSSSSASAVMTSSYQEGVATPFFD